MVQTMMNCSRVFMLASDHRWQWEEWCDTSGMARPRISEIKRAVFDGYALARERSADVRQFGSLLLDNKYGADVVALAKTRGIRVGTPVERAGVFPLEWEQAPFHAGSAGNSFSKVLIRYRPEWPAAARAGQTAKLLEHQAWCRVSGIPLLVEIIIMRGGEDEREFEEHGRPSMLAGVIRDAYASGLVPAIWKIEGTPNRAAATMIDAAIRERPEPRQVILGKGANAESIAGWFNAAAALPSTAGFAIGRSVFMEPAKAYLAGECAAAEVADTIASRYLGFIEQWKACEAVD